MPRRRAGPLQNVLLTPSPSPEDSGDSVIAGLRLALGWLMSRSMVPAPRPAAATNQVAVFQGTIVSMVFAASKPCRVAHLLRVAVVVANALLMLDRDRGHHGDDGGFGSDDEAHPAEDAAHAVRVASRIAAVRARRAASAAAASAVAGRSLRPAAARRRPRARPRARARVATGSADGCRRRSSAMRRRETHDPQARSVAAHGPIRIGMIRGFKWDVPVEPSVLDIGQ